MQTAIAYNYYLEDILTILVLYYDKYRRRAIL